MTAELNWLFILSDQHRWDWLGLYDNVPVRTPTLDRLAADGILFTNTVCASPLCAPSRASLAIGKRAHRTGVPDNAADVPADSRTYLHLLRDAGYRVGAVGKTDLHKKTKWWGLDGWTSFCGQIGFTETVDCAGKWDGVGSGWPEPQDPYFAYLHERGVVRQYVEDFEGRRGNPVTPVRARPGVAPGVAERPTPLALEDYCDNWIGRSGIDLLANFPRDAPWHLTVNLAGPHEPYDAPRELLERYADTEMLLPDEATGRGHQRRGTFGRTPQLRRDDRGHRRHLRRADRGRRRTRRAGPYGDRLRLRSRRDARRAWPVEQAGDVRPVRTGSVDRRRTSGRAARCTTDALVELPDLPATFLDLAGIAVPADWDARSFRPLLEGTANSHRDVQVSILHDRKMIFDGRLKLMVDSNGEQLFDIMADPGELHDLGDTYPAERKRLRDLLDREFAVS